MPTANPHRRTPWLALALCVALFLAACTSAPHAKQPNERQAKAMAMWQERCKTAGERIVRTVENVDGVFLLKLRPKESNDGNQFRLDDPYGNDFGGDAYIRSFLHDPGLTSPAATNPDWPKREGYLYVEAVDPRTGTATGTPAAGRKWNELGVGSSAETAASSRWSSSCWNAHSPRGRRRATA